MIFKRNKKIFEEEKNSLQKEIELLKQERDNLKLQNANMQKHLSENEMQIQLLKDENGDLSNQLSKINKERDNFANKIDKALVQRYNAELARLSHFIQRWQSALPESDCGIDGKRRRALAMALAEILKDKPCVNSVEEGVLLLDKLNSVMGGNAQSESGFNLEEVLNPGNELDLESLCKELGVMD